MSKELQIIEWTTEDNTSVVIQKDKRNISDIKDALTEVWIWWDFMAWKILELMNSKSVTNTWIEYTDNKTVLETVKLVLKLSWIRWIWDWPQIAIFNNIPKQDEKLQY